MKTLLRIDASIRVAGSHTRTLTQYFEQAWLQANPGGQVIRRCLALEPIPHLSQEAFEAFHPENKCCSASDQLIAELKRADHLLIGSPLYNLGMASSLKAYFDHIVRHGETFEATEEGYHGLLKSTSATLITARGGFATPDFVDDYQTDYLRQILSFMGIKSVDVVALEGTAIDAKAQEQAVRYAKSAVDQCFASANSPIWLGECCDLDRQAIEKLRSNQATAIINGDAEAYAELCADDVQLLIPAQDLVVGKAAFLRVEQALFSQAEFAHFGKYPERVECSGHLVIETGRQEVGMKNSGHSKGVFSSRQKYTHVYRRTKQGWRYAVLMSNPCDH